MVCIYADNAATTKIDEGALSSMMVYLQSEYGNPSSIHYMSTQPKKALKESAEIIANCINAKPSEIYFTSGGTESDNWALNGFLSAEKKQIIITSIEHSAIINTCSYLSSIGFSVDILHVNSEGRVDLDELESVISPHTAIVSIMHGNNEIGTIQDLKMISDIVHRYGALFHTDAVQTVGHIPIDVNSMGVDLLSSSAHKFNGPRGVGFLFVRNGVNIRPWILGGNQQKGMRSGTENVPGIVGMATALKKNVCSIQKNLLHQQEMENLFHLIFHPTGVNFKYNGDLKHKIPGLISISFQDLSAESIVDIMSIKGVCISAGSACNSHKKNISHVLKAIDLSDSYAYGTVRISLGIYNTLDEVRIICKLLIETVESLHGLIS